MTRLSTRPSIGGDALRVRRRRGGVKHTYRDAVLDDHPVVFWPLSDPVGSLAARDLSGNGYDGVVAAGHQTLVFGVPGATSDGASALQHSSVYNANDPAAATNTNASMGGGNHAFSVEVSVWSYSLADGGLVMSIGPFTAGAGWTLYLTSTNVHLMDLVTFDEWSWPHGIDPTTATPHFFVVTYDGVGTARSYVDGADRGVPTIFGTPSVNLTTPGVYADGAEAAGCSGQMTLADVAFYNYALSASQVAAHVAAR